MLRAALNATIEIRDDRRGVVAVTNDRTGHSFPAGGMNSLIVTAVVLDEPGREVDRRERTFGTREWIPDYLDFWPFLQVSKIPHGQSREICREAVPPNLRPSPPRGGSNAPGQRRRGGDCDV